jgi:hypothetical protein
VCLQGTDDFGTTGDTEMFDGTDAGNDTEMSYETGTENESQSEMGRAR